MRISIALLLLLPLFSFSQNINHSTVSIKLIERIENQPTDFQPILILLEDRVDIQNMVNDFDENNVSIHDRPQILINALQNKARGTQSELVDFIKNSSLILENSLRTYWISNIIFAKAKPELIAQLSNRNDIEWIGWSGPLEMEAVEAAPAFVQPNGVEPGLEVVGAPFMWNLGYTGYGQLAFTNDTGIDRFHPSYENKYRGLYSELAAAWFDYDEETMAAIPGAEPRDCDGHGTHVNGTILGLDRRESDTIGVAFNAQWIGAPILCGIGTADNVAAFEWSLNPDGNIDTTDDIPDVINNSWYDPSLDTLDCVSIYVPILEALEAVGVAVIFSAGNMGSDPMSITQPHNINVNLVNTFTVGALNGNNAGLQIADFSSRGPSHCGGEGSLLIKPEVSAPGVNVRSARPNGTYGNLSGTSMASPHVAGCVLLLKEAFPDLSAVELKESLYFSCIDLGNPGEDNTYGMGVINVENAYNYLLNLGHQPVSPYRNTDVLLIDLQTSEIACENEIGMEVLVENAGIDSLFSFQISYEAGGITQTYNWNGALATKERASILLPTVELPTGEYLFKVELANPNNTTDERPLNNRLERYIETSPRPYLDAFVVAADAVCENTNALLRGSYNGNGTADFLWYDAPFDGNLLGTGNSFLLDELTEETTIYASAIFTESISEPTLDLNEEMAIDIAQIGVTFDANTNFTIKSILVYAAESGVRGLVLKDAEDQSLGSKAIVLDAGFTRINVDFEVLKGAGYSLYQTIGKPFSTSNQTANFPYKIEGVCAIDKSIGFANENQFPVFMDWEIEYENPCLRTPILLELQDAENPPIPDFTTSGDTLNLFFGDIIQFFDNSNEAVEWIWHIDNLGENNEQNPIFNFTEVGEYLVSLTVINEEGCSNSIQKTITVIDESPNSVSVLEDNSNILVYPNPTTEDLQISFSLNKNQFIKMTLIDAVGKTIRQKEGNYFKENIEWNVSNLNNGVYYLVFEMEGKVILRKVVKI